MGLLTGLILAMGLLLRPARLAEPGSPAPRDGDGGAGEAGGLRGNLAWRQARKVVVLLVGGSVVLLGIVLIVTPGPAFVVIPAGLAILATEFVWARRLLRQARKQGRTLGRKLLGKGDSAPTRENADDDHCPAPNREPPP